MAKTPSIQKQRRRLFHQALKKVLGNDNVYFQSPSTVKMKYPCIIYSVDRIKTIRADNKAYINKRAYQVISITTNPDTDIREDMLEAFDHCYFERDYTSDGLLHNVFTIYF